MSKSFVFLVVVLFVLLSFISVAVEGKKKNLPLPPLFVWNVGHYAKEPSGLTYSALTDRIYMISDQGHFLYEFDTDGKSIDKYSYGEYKDIEAVASNDNSKLLYIAEEGERLVVAFKMDDYTKDGKKKILKEVGNFHVVTGNSTSSKSGIEGMTINTRTGDVIVANEKDPAMIIHVTSKGKPLLSNEITYAKDISGLAYDDQLDALWVASDKMEKVYLTDITGTIVYDSWDLPVKHPEGIAINNKADPPLLYIATDPSDPSGTDYVPLLLEFYKPTNGTGYANYDPNNLPSYVTDPPTCVGCHEAFEEAVSIGDEKAEYWISFFPEDNIGFSWWGFPGWGVALIVVFSVGLILLVALILVIVVFGLLFRAHQRGRAKADISMSESGDNGESQESGPDSL